MIVTTKQLFKLAYGKYAIGAYNINNLEQTMGLFRGNMDSKAPFIIQISKGARSFTHKKMLEGLIRAADEVFQKRYLLFTWIMEMNKLAWIASIAVSIHL
jgi:fructose-bisphosphate aldolase, class II